MIYFILENGIEVWWLFNYWGGFFVFLYMWVFECECFICDISFEIIFDVKFNSIFEEIVNLEINMDVMKLEKVFKIVVYILDVNFCIGGKI